MPPALSEAPVRREGGDALGPFSNTNHAPRPAERNPALGGGDVNDEVSNLRGRKLRTERLWGVWSRVADSECCVGGGNAARCRG